MTVRFSQAQADAVKAARLAFNTNQRRIGEMLPSGATAALIGNAQTLPRDVWEAWDRDTIAIQRDAMPLYERLSGRVGRPISIGKLISYFGKASDSSEAVVSLDGTAKARRDAPTIAYEGTPIPIIQSSYGFGWRQVEAAMTDGWDGLDVAARDNANRKVAAQINTHLLAGNAQVVYGGSQLYGFRTYPGRNTRSTGATLNGTTGANWMTEIKATLALLHGDNFKAPATIALNWDDWWYAATTDYSSSYANKTILQRIREMEGVADVFGVPDLAADEIIAYIEDRRVVEVLNAMPMVTRPMFRQNPTDDYDFEVMAATATVFKRDADGNCGIAHST